jgi:FixJ family two-component response regulator
VSAQTVRKAKKKMQATLSLATGAPSGARSLSSIHAVSRRELQVASLIRAGLQKKEVAATLGRSIDTVRVAAAMTGTLQAADWIEQSAGDEARAVSATSMTRRERGRP